MEIRELRAADGDAIRELWRASGIRIRPGDDDEALSRMSTHNPGLCLVGTEDDRVVATALAGFDGRRGWLYHVATHPEMRRRGIATRLVHEIEAQLAARGCRKVNLIVWNGEDDAMRFWETLGYGREPTVEYSKRLDDA